MLLGSITSRGEAEGAVLCTREILKIFIGIMDPGLDKQDSAVRGGRVQAFMVHAG